MRGAAALSWSTRSGRPALPAVVAREPPQGSPRRSADPTRTPGAALFAMRRWWVSARAGSAGRWPPRASIARAMSASAEWKPNATQVEHPDLGVGGFDQPLGQAVVEGGVDRVAVFDDAVGEFDEDRDAAAPRPRDPPVQGLLAFLAFDRERVPQALFQQVGPIQAGVGLGDPGQLGGLAFGEVFGVLPQRVAGAFELARLLVAGDAARCCWRGGRDPTWARCRASARASFQARRRSASSASVAHATTWNGSAHRTAPGQRSVTTSAIQRGASADTCVISVQRSAPRASKKRCSVFVSRPAAAQISVPVSWSTTMVRYLWWRL